MLAAGENRPPCQAAHPRTKRSGTHAPPRTRAAESDGPSSTIQVGHAEAVSDKMESLGMPLCNRSDLILVQFNSANTATLTNSRLRAFNSGGRTKIFRLPA